MATANVLLLEQVPCLGSEGEEVRVKAGYARNFLFPFKKAIPLTQSNRKQIESLNQARSVRLAKDLSTAEELATKLKKTSIAIAVKTGEQGKFFGAVTGREILERLVEEGFELTKKQLSLPAPIKTLGKHSIGLKLHSDVTLDFNFEVVSENPLEE